MGDHRRAHVYGHIPWWYWTIRPQWWTAHVESQTRGTLATLSLLCLYGL